jgi:hypothetical protein
MYWATNCGKVPAQKMNIQCFVCIRGGKKLRYIHSSKIMKEIFW